MGFVYLFCLKTKNIILLEMKKTEINIKLGKRIRYLRLLRGYSQEKLAEAIDIATTSLSYIETGRGFMTLATLEKLAKVLDVELWEIFQFSFIKSKEEMYNSILTKIDLIKNDETKLKIIYQILNSM